MRIVALDEVRPRARRVALGQFDGVHRGHREIVRGCDTVLAFEPHPQTVVGRRATPPVLSPLAHKARLLSGLGVEELVVVRFDAARAAQSPEDFVEDVLVRALGAVEVSVGANFRYGHRAAGDTASLAADGRFAVRVADLLRIDGAPVSSTRIRGLIDRGDLRAAAELLGSPVHLRATVSCPAPGPAFDDVGALVLLAPEAALPPMGRYACRVGGETTALTITGQRSRHGQAAGWLEGPSVEIRRGAGLAIDLADPRADDVACPPALRTFDRAA